MSTATLRVATKKECEEYNKDIAQHNRDRYRERFIELKSMMVMAIVNSGGDPREFVREFDSLTKKIEQEIIDCFFSTESRLDDLLIKFAPEKTAKFKVVKNKG